MIMPFSTNMSPSSKYSQMPLCAPHTVPFLPHALRWMPRKLPFSRNLGHGYSAPSWRNSFHLLCFLRVMSHFLCNHLWQELHSTQSRQHFSVHFLQHMKHVLQASSRCRRHIVVRILRGRWGWMRRVYDWVCHGCCCALTGSVLTGSG